ncbi:MAG: protein kinase [Myxococcales bacterium]|nr:protein kinase [Myxococcales bacterium]MCB9718811.1 protein kinase [Myxococcales bacterium]
MGTVLLAVDEQLQRRVAIKFLDVERGEREELTALLREEARAMARVRHPNVVQIHAFGEHDGVPYFVMEYVPGAPLSTDDPTWSSLDAAISVLEQIARGLEGIHRAGAVHNDLKPGNVIIGPGQRVVVADFGLATSIHGSHSPRLAGTPAYLSPEVARGDPVEPALVSRRDLYALGVMAFELLVGQRPFRAKGLEGLLQQHAFEPPPRATELRPELPASFDAFFERALAKDPAERFASAELLRRAMLDIQHATADGQAPLRILVVEDEAVARRGLEQALRDEFPAAEIEAHATGEAAHAAASREPPDVVVTDLHMPGRGGVGLTAALRADPRTRSIPIIVVTGLGGAKDWEILRRLGADRFLVKPLDLDELVTSIRALVDRSRRPRG